MPDTFLGALVLRPAPANAATAARLTAAGVDVIRQPLFAVAPVAWSPPDPARFDALLLTSTNAVRHAGAGLRALAALPALAVGEATAAAARAAGLAVALTGERDAAALAAAARDAGYARLVHLAGEDRVNLPTVEAITAYRSAALPLAPATARAWEGRVALLHSPRAARRFAALVDGAGLRRAAIAVAAISPAVADAAGPGWAALAVADRPRDDALVACALALIDPRGRAGDKWAR